MKNQIRAVLVVILCIGLLNGCATPYKESGSVAGNSGMAVSEQNNDIFNEYQAAYERGGYVAAYKKIRPPAEGGNAEAQTILGWMLEEGKGAPQNYAEAIKWYRNAAEQGYSNAQLNLGMMYHDGKGVPQNLSEAMKWFRKAAEQGNPIAQRNLGEMNKLGQGVPQDFAEAAKWFIKAAEQGNSEAQASLGYLYAMGKGVPQDFTAAARWSYKAAEQGHAVAQYNLGLMYWCDGRCGVRHDLAEAQKWFRKSAEQGYFKAQNILKEWSTTEIPLNSKGTDVYELPVRINGVLTLNFILDTGASEVNIPADVALTLLRTGTITQSDFLPGRFYELADGSVLKSSRLNLRELEIGGIRISQVTATIGSAKGSPLLGQSFLRRLESWSLDNKRHVLIVGDQPFDPDKLTP